MNDIKSCLTKKNYDYEKELNLVFSGRYNGWFTMY